MCQNPKFHGAKLTKFSAKRASSDPALVENCFAILPGDCAMSLMNSLAKIDIKLREQIDWKTLRRQARLYLMKTKRKKPHANS